MVEHGAFITGPFAAMILADLGAEVVKVERPDGGDPFRTFESGRYGPQFQAWNRGKRSVQLDLGTPAGRATLHALLAEADVYVENTRPGVAERLGLGPAALRALNPRLIHCAITGFGADGPYAGRPAYDTVAQALSGFLSMFSPPEAPRVTGPAVADAVTGLYAALGILGALQERHRTGAGRLVEVSMLGAMAHFSIEQFQRLFATGTVPGVADRARVSLSFAFRCADGKALAVHLSSPAKFWDGLVAALEAPELAADTRFAGRMDRVANHAALEAALRPIFAARPRAEWLLRLAARDVPHAPIHALDEALEDPQMRHLGLEEVLHHPTEGEVRTLHFPVRFDGMHADAPLAPPPALDEHGAAIRADPSRAFRPREGG